MEATQINLLDEINQLRERINELESHNHNHNHNNHNNHKTTQLEPAECDICHKIFKNKYILKTHKQNMHSNERERYNCPHCNKTFASKYYLTTHINRKHIDSDSNPDFAQQHTVGEIDPSFDESNDLIADE